MNVKRVGPNKYAVYDGMKRLTKPSSKKKAMKQCTDMQCASMKEPK